MSPLNHKRTTSSLAPPIISVAKKIGNIKIEGSPFLQYKKSYSGRTKQAKGPHAARGPPV